MPIEQPVLDGTVFAGGRPDPTGPATTDTDDTGYAVSGRFPTTINKLPYGCGVACSKTIDLLRVRRRPPARLLWVHSLQNANCTSAKSARSTRPELFTSKHRQDPDGTKAAGPNRHSSKDGMSDSPVTPS